MAGIPLKYESFGIYHPSNALLCYYLVLRSFSLKMTFFFTTIFITPLPSGCCSLSNRTPLFWMWSSKQKTKLRIYALCRPNKAIVIKNNPKEKDLGDEKLKKVRNMKFYLEIGCFFVIIWNLNSISKKQPIIEPSEYFIYSYHTQKYEKSCLTGSRWRILVFIWRTSWSSHLTSQLIN